MSFSTVAFNFPIVHKNRICYNGIMRCFLLIICIGFVFICGCQTPPDKLRVHYDGERDLYVASNGPAKGAVLRDNAGNIIRHESEKDRLLEKYNENPENSLFLQLDFERVGLFIRHDYRITSLYFAGVKEMNNGNYEKSIDYLKRAEYLYPAILYYSDVSFLIGYCYEKTNKHKAAEEYYKRFIDKAAQKYSARFNEIDSICAGVYREQLEYARKYINNEQARFDDSFTENETVKYYNNSHYPGFAVGLKPGISSFGFTLIPNFEKIEESFIYLGMSYTFNSWFDAGGTFGFPVPVIGELFADFQLLRTKDRRFGISLETSLFYMYRENIMVNYELVKLDDPLHYINAGAKLGTGFYILPDLFAGGYYQYNLYNEYNKFEFESGGEKYTTWNTNSYRVTLKYVFFKTADLDLSWWKDELYFGLNTYFYTYNLFLGYGFLENRFVIKLNSVDLVQL